MKNIFYNSRIITLFLFPLFILFTSTNCAQKSTDEVAKLMQQKKFELAIKTIDKEISKKPDKIWSSTELCFSEGAKLLKVGDYKNADLLCKYAIKIIKTHSLAFPNSFDNYLLSLNNSDSIINLVVFIITEYPSSYGDIVGSINRVILQLESSKIKKCFGKFVDYEDGYSNVSYLFPNNYSPDLCEEYFGQSTFDPIASDNFTWVRSSQITSISMDNLYTSISKDGLYTSNGYVDIHFSTIPELSDYFSNLKTKTKFQIAAEKENIINKIIETRNKYLISNLKYLFTAFEVYGKCFAFQQEYNFDSKEALIHLFLVNSRYNRESTVYVATAKVPLSLDDAKIFFSSELVVGKVIYKLSPGAGRKKLGIAGGGVADQIMPNLQLLEEPQIIFEDHLNSITHFTVSGLKGELWPSNLNTGRWDMNNMWQQNYGQKPYRDNMRLVVGKKY